MSFTERLKLLSFAELHHLRENTATMYEIVNHLDTICTHPQVNWLSPNLFTDLRHHCREAMDEMTIHSMGIAVAYVHGLLINVSPIVEAGYNMQYLQRGNVLSDILWTTPRGRIRLEYRNDHTRRLK